MKYLIKIRSWQALNGATLGWITLYKYIIAIAYIYILSANALTNSILFSAF